MSELLHLIKEGGGSNQLICFPYLGGYSNSFIELANELKLDDGTEILAINPPGHGPDTQTPFDDINKMLDVYCAEIQKKIKQNCTFFGYSMGGIIAYFTAQRLLRQGNNCCASLSLIISSSNTPQEYGGKKYSSMSDDELLEQMISYGGFPEDILREKELLTCFLPVFRADFRVMETASELEYEKLDIPIYIFLGDNDKSVPFNSLIQWNRYFKRDMSICLIKCGSHMMIHEQVSSVARMIERILGLNSNFRFRSRLASSKTA